MGELLAPLLSSFQLSNQPLFFYLEVDAATFFARGIAHEERVSHHEALHVLDVQRPALARVLGGRLVVNHRPTAAHLQVVEQHVLRVLREKEASVDGRVGAGRGDVAGVERAALDSFSERIKVGRAADTERWMADMKVRGLVGESHEGHHE